MTQGKLDERQKKLLIGAAVVGVAGAVGYALYKSSQASKSSNDDVVWQAPAKAQRKADVSGQEAKKDKKEAKAAKQDKGASSAASKSAAVEPERHIEPGASLTQEESLETGVWPQLGLTLGDLGAWKIALDEEKQAVLAVNNAAIMRFTHNEHSSALGDQPVLNFLIEDQTKECYKSTQECAEAQLARNLTQELPEGMPPGMAELLRPRVVESKSTKVGPFDYLLVYDQQGPGMMLRSRQLQRLHNGIFYTLQVCVPSQMWTLFESDMEALARSITLTKTSAKANGTQVYTSAKAKEKIAFPLYWVSGRPPTVKLSDAVEGAISFDTNSESPQRRDEIRVYVGKEKRGEDLAKEVSAEFSSAALKPVAGVEGAWSFATKGAHPTRVYVKGAFVVQVVAGGDEIVTAPESSIRPVLESIGSADGEEGLRVHSSMGASFKSAIGATIIESNWSDQNITYNVSREEGAPSLIVALPTVDPEKPPPDTIEGWFDRIEEEFPQTENSRIEEKKYEEIAGQKAVAFVTREMVPSGGQFAMYTGAADEHKAKMYVLYHNKKAYLIRFSTLTGEFRRLENTLKPLLASLTFDE